MKPNTSSSTSNTAGKTSSFLKTSNKPSSKHQKIDQVNPVKSEEKDTNNKELRTVDVSQLRAMAEGEDYTKVSNLRLQGRHREADALLKEVMERTEKRKRASGMIVRNYKGGMKKK